MKKKHLVLGMLAVMMVAAVSFLVASCSKDNNSGGGGTSSTVIGTWKGYDDEDELTLKFNVDGTGTSTYKEYSSYYGYSIETCEFTYTMEDKTHGTMVVKNYSYTYGQYHYESFTFEIEGSKMYVYEEDYGHQYLCIILTKQ